MRLKPIAILVILSLGLSGCSAFYGPQKLTKIDLEKEKEDFAGKVSQPLLIKEVDRIPIALKEIVGLDPARTVSIDAAHTSWFGTIEELAKRNGYAVRTIDKINRTGISDIQIRNQSFQDAIHSLAELAGYVAIINESQHSITIANEGSFTFLIPANAIKLLAAQYSVNSTSASSSGATGGAGSSSATSPSTATFSLSSNPQNAGAIPGGFPGMNGSIPSTTTNLINGQNPLASFNTQSTVSQAQNITTILQSVSGNQGTAISVLADAGMITVRGNGQALRRVHDFLRTYCADVMRSVDITTAMIEVNITDEFQYGIKWSQILGNAAGSGLDTTGGVATDGIVTTAPNFTYTTANIANVVKALEKFTKVKMLTSPKITTTNHVSGEITNQALLPYLPTVTTTVTGTTGTAQTSASAAFAMDGVSVSVTPHILSNDLVQLQIMPISNVLGTLQSLGSGISAFNQSTKHAFMNVLTPNEKTVILSGVRNNNTNDTREGIPGMVRVPVLGALFGGTDIINGSKEFVILMHVSVSPSPAFEPLQQESL